MWSRDSYHL